jgi:hypothetical protein
MNLVMIVPAQSVYKFVHARARAHVCVHTLPLPLPFLIRFALGTESAVPVRLRLRERERESQEEREGGEIELGREGEGIQVGSRKGEREKERGGGGVHFVLRYVVHNIIVKRRNDCRTALMPCHSVSALLTTCLACCRREANEKLQHRMQIHDSKNARQHILYVGSQHCDASTAGHCRQQDGRTLSTARLQ